MSMTTRQSSANHRPQIQRPAQNWYSEELYNTEQVDIPDEYSQEQSVENKFEDVEYPDYSTFEEAEVFQLEANSIPDVIEFNTSFDKR